MDDRPASSSEPLAPSHHAPSLAVDDDNSNNSNNNIFLTPPPSRPTLFESDSQRDSLHHSLQTSNNGSAPLLPAAADKLESNRSSEVEENSAKLSPRRRLLRLTLLGLAALIVVVLAVILPVYFAVIKPKQNNSLGSNTSSSDSPVPTPADSKPDSPARATTGGDGSTVTTEDGSQFTYSNKLGGFWVYDPNDPFNDSAQPNSWTPPLNQTWRWGKDRVFGVNLGGLFVLEPFITPAFYQKYPGAVDEWTLSTLMAADKANGGLAQLEEHYKTFITEQDIAEMAGAGLNWIRLPIPYWAVETWPGEPFLAKTSWKYILRLLGWCRKYGIRVNLDLHTVPGSQNGYNHSGKLGVVNFLNGVMGIANAQRTLDYIRIITEFISQSEYKNVVPMFSIINEALVSRIGKDPLTSFYLEAHNMIRSITGYGEGNGPYIAIHDGFTGMSRWSGFLPGSDRIALDTHPYFAFDGSASTDPIDTGTGPNAGGIWPKQACQRWGAGINGSRSDFGVTIAGEFSNGFNDCGLFLHGVPGRSTTYGGDCNDWENWQAWSDGTKAGLMQFALASMDALQDFFFWTWKIGNSTTGTVQAPLWSYQLGLRNGWMPKDPRRSVGTCAALGVSGPAFDGTFQPWQTGGAGAGTFQPAATAGFAWPPASLANADAPASLLPSYTRTGTVPTLPPPTLTPAPTPSVSVGSGWFNAQDTASAYTSISGCSYPDPWSAVGVPLPTSCTGGGADSAPATTAGVTSVPVPAVTAPSTTT